MAQHKVGDRVKLRSGRIGTIDLVSGAPTAMAMNTSYRVLLEPFRKPNPEAVRVSGLEILEVLPSLGHLPPNVRDAALSIRAFHQWSAMNMALRDLDEVLTMAGVRYVLQGSAAALLHGASVSTAPGDLDLLVAPFAQGHQALVPPRFRRLSGGGDARLVQKFVHTNGTHIDLAETQDFMGMGSMDVGPRTAVQGVWVLSLVRTLVSILRRPEKRDKEFEAFNSLILLKGETLAPAERDVVVEVVRDVSGGRIASWQDLVQSAREASGSLNLGI